MKHGLGLEFGRIRRGRERWLPALLVLAISIAAGAADFTYTISTGTTPTATITSYTGPGGVVLIPSTLGGKAVTGIGDRAFYYSSSLTRVTLPNSLTSIGDRAFYYCSGLTGITIPNSVTSIGTRAFYHCSGLVTIMVGSGVTSLGGHAFAACPSLTAAYFQGDPPSLGSALFEGNETATVYYAPGAAGWGTTYGGLPTAVWASPVVTGIGPSHGTSAGGTRVVITGTNLTAATAVLFGAVAATSFTVNSATQIAATAPKGTAGETVDISVTTPGGTAPNTAADNYTYNAIVVSDVASPTRNGTYGPGATIAIRLTFSEKVVVTGSPELTLETGATDAVATYTSGSGTVALIFTYTVQAGQASPDLDCAGTDALALRGGSIVNPAGDPAVLALPIPGRPHSLGVNQALVVAAVGAPNGPFLAPVQAAEVSAGHGLWDLSGAYALTAGGHELSLNLVHDTRGMLTGTGTLQVDIGKARMPLALTVRGNAKGADGSVVATLRLNGSNPAETLGAALALSLALDPATRQFSGPLTGSLTRNGAATPIADSVTLTLPPSMDGTWSLLFELQQRGRESGGTATLTLSNRVTYRFGVYGKVAGSAVRLDLAGRLADPAAAAIRVRTTIETLRGALTELTGFSGKAYGQTLAWP